ncbi:hypothetical protein SCHAM137S_02244 [Streptomyces chartreusis]
MSTPPGSPAPTSYKNTPNTSVSVRGVTFVYRQLGPDEGVPLILLNHLSAVLDNWDPRVVDGLAARRPVVTFDNRGVGASGGSTPGALRGRRPERWPLGRACRPARGGPRSCGIGS